MVKRAKPNGPLSPEEKVQRATILQVRLYPGEKDEWRELCRANRTEMSEAVRALIKTVMQATFGNKLFCVTGQLCRINLKFNEELPFGGQADAHSGTHGVGGA